MRIYLTPMLNKSKSPTQNPYIDDLINSLELEGIEIINKNKFSKLGTFNMIFYILKADAFYFNWIEDLINTKLGLIKTLYFYFCLLLMKLFRKKIIWVLHNKISHSKNNLLLKMINNFILLNYSDLIITHAQDGIEFANLFMKKNNNNLHFFNHPIHNNLINSNQNSVKKYDLLLWGAITPYKGIDLFLNYLYKNNLHEKYKICILGKIKDENLKNEILKYQSTNIEIINEFVDEDKLEEFIKSSKITLFTYTPAGTFASGSLMLSLSYGSNIIGPYVGSFKDIAKEGLITTYINNADLINKIDITLKKSNIEYSTVNQFIANNSWENFGTKISTLVKELK